MIVKTIRDPTSTIIEPAYMNIFGRDRSFFSSSMNLSVASTSNANHITGK